MIFLSDNTLVKRDLRFEDIKPRLLGLTPTETIMLFHS
jgi:phosphoketolase